MSVSLLRQPFDTSRHDGLLDRDLMRGTHIACIGVGGASGLVATLTRCGIATWTLVDFDRVSTTNPATQAHNLSDCTDYKAQALARRLRDINPEVQVTCIERRYQDLSATEADAVRSADLVLAMTDDFATQACINLDAVANGTDALFAICYTDCTAVEITGSFAAAIGAGAGCHRCNTKLRYDAYEAGFTNPPAQPSHAAAAEYLNALLAPVALGWLHQRAGSELAIAEIGRVFAERPCLISRLHPGFGAGPGEAFAGMPPFPFMTSLWPIDTPAGWTCPDCGTAGSIPAASPFSPQADGGLGTTQERREPCADPCNPAAYAGPDN